MSEQISKVGTCKAMAAELIDQVMSIANRFLKLTESYSCVDEVSAREQAVALVAHLAGEVVPFFMRCPEHFQVSIEPCNSGSGDEPLQPQTAWPGSRVEAIDFQEGVARAVNLTT